MFCTSSVIDRFVQQSVCKMVVAVVAAVMLDMVTDDIDSGVSQLHKSGCDMVTTAAPATANGEREQDSATDARRVQPRGRQHHRHLVEAWLSLLLSLSLSLLGQWAERRLRHAGEAEDRHPEA